MAIQKQFVIDMHEATDEEWAEFILDLEAGILCGDVIIGIGPGGAHRAFQSMLFSLDGGTDIEIVEREEQRQREAHARAQDYPRAPFGWF